VRVVALHADVLQFTSAFWQTNAVAVRSGDEGFLIDSPVLPVELESLPGVLTQSSFSVSGLLATHADFDHVLGRYAFPGASLGVAETTSARLRANPGEAQRTLRDWDDQNYVERPSPLSLGDVQSLPVPGRLDIGSQEIELHPTEGHTEDGMAFWIGWAGVLVVGDYLSPVEIPWLSATGSVSAYLATLQRLEPLVAGAATIVPGHGSALESERALAILREDVAYLEALRDHGAEAPLPLARRTGAQKGIHEANVKRSAAATPGG
jgi:glyoxylase-like metal-dependent hydrolase (beta-lactamase superfamily II)